MSSSVSCGKVNVSPPLHVDVIDVLRQRMLIVLPIDAAYAVSHNVRPIQLTPLYNVAVLLGKFAHIAEHEMPVKPRNRDLCLLIHI